MREVTQRGVEVIQQAADKLQEAADQLGVPEVDPLNRRSALNMCAAVAVDAGQSLFGGALRDAGIALFQVASSQEDEDPRAFPLWVAPSLPEDEKRKTIQGLLSKIVQSDEIIARFVRDMGWNNIHDENVMPPSCYQTAGALSNFFRELLEWATLYEIGRDLRDASTKLKVGIQPVLLRDGTLRFDNMGEDHARRLERLFIELDIPILGVTKRSSLVSSAVIRLWLAKHRVYDREGAFVIRLDFEDFQSLGWRLDRYFGIDGMRFGKYALARFDRMPGSRDIFAIDIPDYLLSDWDAVLILLSGVAEHATATAYPAPGYPIALRKAHDKVVLTKDRVLAIENSIRRTLGEDAYQLMKALGL